MDPIGHSELEEVGKKFATKCKGLPLALKTLAGMLCSKSEVEECILRSELWKLPDNDILPALMLSYNDLPAHLKRCFSYCAIFPKGYPFRKEQVIHLWIANGLVPQEDEIIQDLGNQYFLELISRSLFERVPNPFEGTIEFLMHDLVNDVAQIASSKLCIRLEESQGSHMIEQCRHLSYSVENHVDFKKLKPIYKLEQLRTLLPTYSLPYLSCPLSKKVLYNILPRLRSLRALSLSHYRIKELPTDLFIKLKLLRFLDLSETWLTKLPSSICVLYYLDTLLLSSCVFLEELPLQMEKLINLRHLDIRDTPHLKMPLHLSKLKSLQELVGAKFLVGDSRMEDLGEAHNLYGSLSVLELQNVVDRREAMKAKMSEKNHVYKLSLEWSGSIADSSQTERDILDELRPHKNIKELEIRGYRGTKFPNWVADPLFLMNCVQMCLSKCKDCDSLPALGQLPSLKILSIRGMDGITKVTEEFYGSLSSEKPFNSLEKLEFEDMLEWKQWHIQGNGEFPTLEYLSIKNCPELSLETPIQLSSLKRFEVFDCPKVGFLTSQLEGMKQIVQLSVHKCNSLASLPFSILSSTLKSVSLSGCQKLTLEGPVGEMFLEEFRIDKCDCIDDISPKLLQSARTLSVERCPSLTRFLVPAATESLYICECENVEKLSVVCVNLPSAMTSLSIYGCLNLKWLPERMQELLPSLKELILWNCPEIESLPEGGLPFNLQVLGIINCRKLVNGLKEWHLERLPCLRELSIKHDGSDEEILGWELPCSIQRFEVCNLKALSSQLAKSLTSLEYLRIEGNLLHIQKLLEDGQFPSSLSSLAIWDCPNLQSLSESAWPSSLSHLSIKNCHNLRFLSESSLPSSLSHLIIYNCHNVQSLPVKGMPSSLSTLVIDNCPLLTPQLQFDKGEYWPNIAQIPNIKINGECM